MATTMAVCHALWLSRLLAELVGKQPATVKVFVDNMSAIALMKNPIFHSHSKYINPKYHSIRECVEEGQIVIKFIHSDEQRADALTKPLTAVKLSTMRHLLCVHDLEPH
jgi:hypothetical protein